MARSFRLGVFAGLVAPFVYLAGVVAVIYRYTGKVPFPARRTEEHELVIRLVEPGEVRGYWQQWLSGLEPLLAALQRLGDQAKGELTGTGAPGSGHAA